MAKKVMSPEEQHRKDVESAIRSLWSRFPVVYSCHSVKSRETLAIVEAIKSREKELEDDRKLNDLKKKLYETQKDIVTRSKARNAQISDLLRRLQLRGVTEKLISDIEKLSKEPAIELLDSNCC